MHIYIGNLPLETTDNELLAMCEPFGTVRSAQIGTDKKTGQSQGYGLVDMPVKSEARAAVEGLRGKEMNGKPLLARILKPDDPFHASINRGGGFGGGARGGGPVRTGGVQRRGGMRGS